MSRQPSMKERIASDKTEGESVNEESKESALPNNSSYALVDSDVRNVQSLEEALVKAGVKKK